MDYIPQYSKYNLDTLYEILYNMDKEEHPERVEEIVNRISSLEEASLRNKKEKKNKKRLKYALLSSEERLKVSQDPFACFRIVSWTYRDIFTGIGILLVFYAICKILGLYQKFGIKAQTIFFILLIFWLLEETVLFSYPYYICRKRKIWPLFSPISFSKLIKEMLTSIWLFFLISLSIGLAIGLVGILTKLPIKAPEVWKWAEHAPLNQYFIFFLFLAFAVIPVIEEVFFRGFLYNAFKTYMPIALAAVLQAIVFALVHPYDLMNRLCTFLTAIGLVIVYERRKSLVSPILVHCMINFIWVLGIVSK
ncbi:MAG: CPBP family intramembrane metalloprotease [Deltaproteobacteria bacterium]|nr:CPBP family intramembrane metalloprotease [Deltaproteobacteria bacterium]